MTISIDPSMRQSMWHSALQQAITIATGRQTKTWPVFYPILSISQILTLLSMFFLVCNLSVFLEINHSRPVNPALAALLRHSFIYEITTATGNSRCSQPKARSASPLFDINGWRGKDSSPWVNLTVTYLFNSWLLSWKYGTPHLPKKDTPEPTYIKKRYLYLLTFDRTSAEDFMTDIKKLISFIFKICRPTSLV